MNEARKRFVTVFQGYKDFHFYKDPGQVPFRFARIGYSSSIVTLSDETDLTLTRRYLDIIKIRNTFFYRKFNSGILVFLLRKSHRIDILNLFHFTWQSLLFAFVYKILNPNGFVYLKMDSSRYSGVYDWEKNFEKNTLPPSTLINVGLLKTKIKNNWIRKFFVGKVDLWSVEDNYTNQAYQSQFSFMRGRMVTVYNGHTADLPDTVQVKSFESKEDIILTVGRLGSYQKATELLLEAFRIVADGNKFELHLAGPAEPDFEKTIQSYFENNPGLTNRVFIHGNLKREDLFRLYNRSKILCMPSRFEGMAIVFPEAMYFRNAVLTTPNVSPAGIIRDLQLGLVTVSGEPSHLADRLIIMINDRNLTKELAENAHNFAVREFNWDKIVSDLDAEIKRRKCS